MAILGFGRESASRGVMPESWADDPDDDRTVTAELDTLKTDTEASDMRSQLAVRV